MLLVDSRVLLQANLKQPFPCETRAEADLAFGKNKKIKIKKSAALCSSANMQGSDLAVLLSRLEKKKKNPKHRIAFDKTVT